ncbi:MAG: hypothetical protein NVS3B11_05400 [Collimonas sp.]
MRDIANAISEIKVKVKNRQISTAEGAKIAQLMRNEILDLSRLRSSSIGRAYAMSIKKGGRSMADLTEKYSMALFKKPFGALSEVRQSGVYAEIINAAGRPDLRVAALAKMVGKMGKRLLLVSLAIAVYEINEAEDKVRETTRQGTLATAGIVGGSAVGAGAIAAGACAATAPVCVSVAALIGAILFSAGANFTFGTLYPRPGKS